jgi:hypothetical protein
MRDCSCYDEGISCIEEYGFFRIFYMEIVSDESDYQNYCDNLEGESRDRERECDPRVIREMKFYSFSPYLDIC